MDSEYLFFGHGRSPPHSPGQGPHVGWLEKPVLWGPCPWLACANRQVLGVRNAS